MLLIFEPESHVPDLIINYQILRKALCMGAELKKHGNLGNYFPEPMTVFRNQESRQWCNIHESLKLLGNKSKKDCI
jgi:hypothetical protein